ncbi:MAG TPA: dihydroxyacetone kinase, partial [Clostridiaceae bacterium]|nr:dihydroxyacetone kinase [Clostridiaceae bacterium]
AANQAKDISDKDVYVIPTKTIPQGVAALTAFIPELDVEANYENLMASLETVKSGSVTYAVRDTEIEGKEVKQGDFLGLLESKIKVVKRELYPLVEELIELMVDDESSSITLFYGEDVNEEEFNELTALLEEKYEDLDVMSVAGRQPLYYFIIAVE